MRRASRETLAARRSRRALSLTALIAVALHAALPGPLGPPVAQAHDGRHDFEILLSGIAPIEAGAGIELRVLDYDERIELTNRSGKTVIVLGYEGEPYARIESTGPVQLNLHSPSLAPSNDRWGRTPPSGRQDAEAPPHWVRVADGGRWAWFDRRSHYRGPGRPAAVEDPARRLKLWDFAVPLRIDGQPARIEGTLYWLGRRPFPTGAFIAMLLATAAVALIGARVVRRLR